MASPSPVTMPAFVVAEGQVFVLRKGSTVFGQVSRVNPRSNTPSRKIARLGDTNKATSLSPTENTVSMEIYHEKDPKELALLLGGTQKPASGGWVGSEQLALNATVTPFDLSVDVYDGATGTSDSLVGTWEIADFRPASMNVNIQADSASTITIDGEPSALTYEPAAGVGA